MNNLIKNLGVKEDFSIRTVIKVEELMNHDMIYVYHHLNPGSVVDLKQEGSNLFGDPRYSVLYKGFKLGYVTISGMMRSFFEGEEAFQAEVAGVSKDKYMPIKELDIQIGLLAMKKVG